MFDTLVCQVPNFISIVPLVASSPADAITMDNRRENYRCSFSATAPLKAEYSLDGPTLPGEVLDLSTSGLKMRVNPRHGPFQVGQFLRITMRIPGAEEILSFDAQVVHGPHPNDPVIGVHFLPPTETSTASTREKVLWTFILNEQCRKRRLELERLHS